MEINKKSGITLVELMICVVVISLLTGYAWKVYFSGRETMRHTVSQSQIQADMRIMLDQLEVEMASCYSFGRIDTKNNYFSFFSFTYNKTPLDMIYYDNNGKTRSTGTDSEAKILVVKYEYYLNKDKKVIKSRTPGYLYFLKEPILFVPSNSGEFDDYKAFSEKVMLNDIVDFNVIAYSQTRKENENSFTVSRINDPQKTSEASFIVLRLHVKIDEAPNRRDEELDIVTKFYSSYKLADNANPGSFSSTDHDGRF